MIFFVLILGGGLVGLAFLTLLVLQHVDRSSASRGGVPWISSEVWKELEARRPRGPQRTTIIDPTLIEASEADQARAPQGATTEPLAARGTLTELRRALEGTPAPAPIRQPVWPVSSNRLCTLVAHQTSRARLQEIEAEVGALDAAFLEEEIESWGGPDTDPKTLKTEGWSTILAAIRAGEHDGTGVNIFHCSEHGHYYVASCGPS